MSASGKGGVRLGGDWEQITRDEYRRELPDGSSLQVWRPPGGRYWEYAHYRDEATVMWRSGAESYLQARERADDYAATAGLETGR